MPNFQLWNCRYNLQNCCCFILLLFFGHRQKMISYKNYSWWSYKNHCSVTMRKSLDFYAILPKNCEAMLKNSLIFWFLQYYFSKNVFDLGLGTFWKIVEFSEFMKQLLAMFFQTILKYLEWLCFFKIFVR